MASQILGIIALLFSGVLAGAELMVRWGIQPALTALDDHSHLEARQSLVRRLRVLVPAVMVPTLLLSIAVLIVGGEADGLAFRVAAVVVFVAYAVIAFTGTVPINIQVIDWDPALPPADWKRTLSRWERIDVFRSSAALLGFVFLAIDLGV